MYSGDFNFNLLDCDSNKTKILFKKLSSQSLIPVITKPTRPNLSIDNLHSTLTDHIWTTIPSVKRSSIIDVEITDHLPNLSLHYRKCENFTKFIRFRDFIIENKTKCLNEIDLIDYDLFDGNDVDMNTTIFIYKIESVFDKCFPICQKQITNKSLNNPWLTLSLVSSINELHELSKVSKQGLVDKEFYRFYRNNLNMLIRKAKGDYYDLKFKKCIGNMRKTWTNINKINEK